MGKKRSSVEEQKLKYNHKTLNIGIDKIKENTYNPNVMDGKIFGLAKENIKREGFVGAIICRENPEKKDEYIIIDGEHRWKAAKELGYEEISVIVLDKNLPDAMISTISFNKLKGEIDTLKLAEIINKLTKIYGMKELEERLGFSEDEISGLEDLLQFDPSQFKEDGIELGEDKKGEYKFTVVLNEEQYKILQNTLKTINKKKDAEKITIICSKYIKKNEKKNK